MVVRPNKNMQADNQYLGRNLFRIMLDGISKRIYGTKKMTKAVLYSLLTSFNSVAKPKTLALAMLTLKRMSMSGSLGFLMSLPIQEGKQVHDTQEWNYAPINLVDQ